MADTIQVLTDREKVRERPGMYIGDNAELGLETIVREVIDNAVDEYANYSDPSLPINVTLHNDNSVTVRDYGRGISPYESSKHPGEIEERLAYTRIGAGGKFKSNRQQNGNMFSAGLNGTGSAATNFMSEFYDVTIYKDSYIFHDRFENGGQPVIELVDNQLPKKKQRGKHETGTSIHFKADSSVMRTTVVNAESLTKYFEQISYIYPGLRVNFLNERDGDSEPTTYYSEHGILDYLDKLATDEDTGKTDYLVKPFLVSGKASDDVLGDEVQMEANIAIAFSKGDNYAMEVFTNGTHNSQGGTHENGFNSGLLKLIRYYYKEFQTDIDSKYSKQLTLIRKVTKEQDISKLFKARDLVRKAYVVIDFKHSNPVLQPQTKDRLASPEAKKAVETIFYDNAMRYLDKNITAVQKIIGSLILDLYSNAKEEDANIQIDKKTEKLAQSSKLAASRCLYPELTELILVEGDSAAGTLKKNRDADFQAILPLRGKVLNVQKATLADALNNLEISTIFSVLGCGYGRNYDESKLKYQKIIIGTDQDVDGLHIRTLLITLFMKYTPDLIRNGHVYYLDTPLFVNELRGKGATEHYTYSKEEQDEFLAKNRKKVVNVSRNKGLGELTPEQTVVTILNPETRKLTQIQIDDEDKSYEVIDQLMGGNSQGRKRLLME